MGRYIITTTTSEDEAIDYAYQQSLTPVSILTRADLQTTETEAEFFERQVHTLVCRPMHFEYRRVVNDSIISSLETIPEADRPAARDEITVIVEKYGGAVVPKPKNTKEAG